MFYENIRPALSFNLGRIIAKFTSNSIPLLKRCACHLSLIPNFYLRPTSMLGDPVLQIGAFPDDLFRLQLPTRSAAGVARPVDFVQYLNSVAAFDPVGEVPSNSSQWPDVGFGILKTRESWLAKLSRSLRAEGGSVGGKLSQIVESLVGVELKPWRESAARICL
jgi:hypothetical protein